MADHLIKWIEPVRQRREDYQQQPQHVLDILDTGSTRARMVAQQTMDRVREAVFGWDKTRANLAAAPARRAERQGGGLTWPHRVRAPYNVHIEAYDGPLDLLLDLIRKQEMDIHNIPISKITGQYLDYLHKLEELDIDVSADFLYMAATLILIKSKMLLPPDPLAGPEEQADPRAELVYRLVEHEKFKNAAQLLYQKQQLEAHVWSKPDLSLYETEGTEARAGGIAGGPGARVPAGAGAAQAGDADRAAPRAVHRGRHDEGAAQPACWRRRTASSWWNFSSRARRAAR